MGTISDLKELAKMGPKLVSDLNNTGALTKSIAGSAKDSTLQFPCLISKVCPIDMASTIARTLDHVYASFTQQVLSMNSMFDVTVDPTPMSYLKKLHQNTRFENVQELFVDENNIPDYMERVYSGEYKLYLNPEKDFGILFNESIASSEITESNKELMKDYLSEFNLTPLEVVKEDSATDNSSLAYKINKEKLDYQKHRDDIKDAMNVGDKTVNIATPKLLDRDVKRSNDMVPYAVQVRLIAVNDKKEFVQYVDFIVGIKTILHPIDSNEIIDNIVRTLKNDNLGFKLLKWTSGEISLFKDIILSVDDMKDDAINRQKGKTPFFSTLKRLKNKKLKTRNFTIPTKILPNSTLVITSYEVDVLQKNYGFDLYRDIIAKRVLEKLFLMAFVIYDEGSDTVSILYDGDSKFQTYSIEGLKRDNLQHRSQYAQEIGKMIGLR